MFRCALGSFLFLSLAFLPGCSTPPTRVAGAASATIGITQTATSTAFPTATPDRDPFQVHFLQHYQVITCPARPNPTNLCYTLEDNPSASSLGMISFTGIDVLYVRPEGGSCGPAERDGAFLLADGDTITIQASGKYCVPGFAVQFTFLVTGGTGHYRHASGGGTIAVGAAGATTAPEFWSGTIAA